MTANGSDPKSTPRADRALLVIVLASGLLAALVRIPTLLAARHLSFDDGVYGASAVAMRNGGVPFRSVFSSQGPLFLPLVYLGDLLGLRTTDSPRVIAVLAGAIVAAGTAALAGRLAPTRTQARVAAAGAGLLAATSGALWWTTGPITSDGPTLALTVAAVLVAWGYRERPSLPRAAAVGVLLGAAVAVKLVMAAPAIAVCALLMLSVRRWRDLVTAAAPIALIPVLAAAPFGFGAVWEQVVTYHTESSVGSRNPLVHLRKLGSTLTDRDLLLTVTFLIALVALIATVARHRSGRERTAPPPWARLTTGLVPIGIWLALTVGVLAIQQPLWRNHVAYVIPPMAVTVGVVFARGGLPTLAIIAGGALVVPYQIIHTEPMWNPAPYRGDEARIVRELRALPPGAQVISDDPGLAWRAGRRTPDNFVDTSVLRITSPVPGVVITTGTVAESAGGPDVCAVVATSPERFGALSGLPEALARAGYERTLETGTGLGVWVRSSCPASDPARR